MTRNYLPQRQLKAPIQWMGIGALGWFWEKARGNELLHDNPLSSIQLELLLDPVPSFKMSLESDHV